jgi:hypothetical protein
MTRSNPRAVRPWPCSDCFFWGPHCHLDEVVRNEIICQAPVVSKAQQAGGVGFRPRFIRVLHIGTGAWDDRGEDWTDRQASWRDDGWVRGCIWNGTLYSALLLTKSHIAQVKSSALYIGTKVPFWTQKEKLLCFHFKHRYAPPSPTLIIIQERGMDGESDGRAA